MGALKFLATLKSDPKTAGLFECGQLTPAICKEIVNGYRLQYPNIPCWWKALEDAAGNAVYGGDWFVNNIRFGMHENTLLITLPSGRALRFANPRFEFDDRTIKYLDDYGEQAEFSPSDDSLVYGEGHSISLYGGKLAENVVQATARDLLVEAVLAIEKKGIPVLFHVHDEVIAEVPADQTDAAYGVVLNLMQVTPAWANGLPVACEGGIAECYGK
jgi:DNA polymerase bacteriophage-type